MKNSELPFLVLTPPKGRDAPPWIVIRGTDPNLFGNSVGEAEKKSSLQSIIADFVGKDISTRPIDFSLEQFNDIMTNLKNEGHPPANLAGHSLGGVFVQDLACKLQEKYEKKDNSGPLLNGVYSYNSPGTSKATAAIYAGCKKKPNIVAFNKVGDLVVNAGDRLIGKQMRIKGDDDRPDVAHRICDLHKPHQLSKVDVKAEESKGARRLLESLRPVVIGSALNGIAKYQEWRGMHEIADWAKVAGQ